jgi:predicted ABC-class ATPase
VRKLPAKKEADIPFVLERTDCCIVDTKNTLAAANSNDNSKGLLQFYLHVHISNIHENSNHANSIEVSNALSSALSPLLLQLTTSLTSNTCYQHIATVVLQRQLRNMLQPPRNTDTSKHTTSPKQDTPYLNAVAFIADGSILPRSSGRSHMPMASPPALPFVSPQSDMLTRTVQVEVGYWKRFLNEDGTLMEHEMMDSCDPIDSDKSNDQTGTNSTTTVSIRGMIIPLGVTLIVGGGYHGKSTLLTAISLGIYDKIPHDGRERCVTHTDALSVRAEDGRYVNQCNVSAFISNLPGKGGDTMRFSTKDASGSTSQAANVMEALECGGSALLVDEDVSVSDHLE